MKNRIIIPARIIAEHARRHTGMTTEQLMDALIETAKHQTPQEKAEVRKLLWASFGKRSARRKWVN